MARYSPGILQQAGTMWGIFPEWLYKIPNDILLPGAKICFSRLLAYGKSNGYAYIRISKLSESINFGQTQTRKFLKTLKELKFIEIEYRTGTYSHIYFIDESDYFPDELKKPKIEIMSFLDPIELGKWEKNSLFETILCVHFPAVPARNIKKCWHIFYKINKSIILKTILNYDKDHELIELLNYDGDKKLIRKFLRQIDFKNKENEVEELSTTPSPERCPPPRSSDAHINKINIKNNINKKLITAGGGHENFFIDICEKRGLDPELENDSITKFMEGYPKQCHPINTKRLINLWIARRIDGNSADKILSGLKEYAEYCKEQNYTGTTSVMNPVKFLDQSEFEVGWLKEIHRPRRS